MPAVLRGHAVLPLLLSWRVERLSQGGQSYEVLVKLRYRTEYEASAQLARLPARFGPRMRGAARVHMSSACLLA